MIVLNIVLSDFDKEASKYNLVPILLDIITDPTLPVMNAHFFASVTIQWLCAYGICFFFSLVDSRISLFLI
jgi:hypothetical protein